MLGKCVLNQEWIALNIALMCVISKIIPLT